MAAGSAGRSSQAYTLAARPAPAVSRSTACAHAPVRPSSPRAQPFDQAPDIDHGAADLLAEVAQLA